LLKVVLRCPKTVEKFQAIFNVQTRSTYPRDAFRCRYISNGSVHASKWSMKWTPKLWNISRLVPKRQRHSQCVLEKTWTRCVENLIAFIGQQWFETMFQWNQLLVSHDFCFFGWIRKFYFENIIIFLPIIDHIQDFWFINNVLKKFFLYTMILFPWWSSKDELWLNICWEL